MLGELTDMIRSHVMRDLRPYVCTYLNCPRAKHTFVSRLAFKRHELFFHGVKGPNTESWRSSIYENCVFCGEVLPAAICMERARHVGRHMEEIAYMVVTKPYEDWDFYSGASTASYQDRDEPRDPAIDHDVRRDENRTRRVHRQRVRCDLCPREKTFSRRENLAEHVRVVHPGSLLPK